MSLSKSLRCGLVFLMLMAGRGALAAPDAPDVQVQLLADQTALVPGKTATLAIAFKIQRGWHIYWQNRGEGGLETTFDWQVPDGYKVGPLRFPAPERKVEEPDAYVFILEGEPVMLADLSVPADAKPGEKVKIGVTVNWLVCKKSCIPGDKELSIELPIVAEASAAKAANETTFEAARGEIPLPAEKAKYLSGLKAIAGVDKVRPGDKFEIAVVMTVARGYHVNSHEPLDKALPATELFNYETPDLAIGRPRFPAGKIEEQKPPADLPPEMAKDFPVEKLSLYRGEVVIRIPIEASGDLAGESVRVGGIVAYQACSDTKGQCYPRTSAEWSVTLPVGKAGDQVTTVALPGASAAEATSAREGTKPPAPPTPLPPEPASPGTTGAAVEKPAPTADSGAAAAETAAPSLFTRLYDGLTSLGILGYIVLAFAGGMLMNLMPCVLPVISIKVLSFVQQAKESRVRVFTLSLAFASGILVFFTILGFLILGLLKGFGLEFNWGGILQIPVLVIVLCAVITALALSLFGVFTLSPPQFILAMGGQIKQEGHLNAFCTGLLATVLGTACTAPLVNGAVAWALTQPPITGLLIFIFIGVGMATPYVVLGAKPAWLKFVPRPGPWMETFEQIMGFVLLGTVVFLLNTVAAQLGGSGLVWTIVFLMCVAGAAWCYGRVGFGAGASRQVAYYGVAVLLLVGGWWWCFRYANTINELMASQQAALRGSGLQVSTDWPDADKIPWVPYTRQRVLDLVNSGKTVFIDYTATWCVNCKSNEYMVIDTPTIRAAMREMGVVPVRADFTLRDPEIKVDLVRYGSGAVPMTIVIPANRPEEPIVLDVLLTKSAVLDALKKAGPSTSAAGSVANR